MNCSVTLDWIDQSLLSIPHFDFNSFHPSDIISCDILSFVFSILLLWVCALSIFLFFFSCGSRSIRRLRRSFGELRLPPSCSSSAPSDGLPLLIAYQKVRLQFGCMHPFLLCISAASLFRSPPLRFPATVPDTVHTGCNFSLHLSSLWLADVNKIVYELLFHCRVLIHIFFFLIVLKTI